MKYIAFLRGINVSGQKKVLMAELRTLLENTGFENVQTYIQSGNIILESPKSSKEVEAIIQKGILDHFGFEVPVLVKTRLEIEEIFNNCPFSEEKKKKSYFTLFYETPEIELVKSVSKLSYPQEEFTITDDGIYFYCEIGYGRTKFNNNFFERKLKTTATARNYNTMVKLLSMSI